MKSVPITVERIKLDTKYNGWLINIIVHIPPCGNAWLNPKYMVNAPAMADAIIHG